MEHDDVIGLAERLPIFFITCRPRSGSTLLRTMFDAHPNIVIPPECQFIINLRKKYLGLDCWTERTVSSFVADLKKQGLIESWKIDWKKLNNILLEGLDRINYPTACKLCTFLLFPVLKSIAHYLLVTRTQDTHFMPKSYKEYFLKQSSFTYAEIIERTIFQLLGLALKCRSLRRHAGSGSPIMS